jgi:sn-1 stearoyl-lipid 9-desaturase
MSTSAVCPLRASVPHNPASSSARAQASRLDWPVIIAISAVHMLALGAVVPALFSWTGLALFVVLSWMTGCLGITVGYHRLLTHRSFRTPRWLEYLLTLIACMAWQGGPVNWVGIHRLHHRHSDADEDPHTPRHGFTWAHVLWTLHRKVDGREGAEAAKDLLRDPVMRWIDRLFWLPQFVLAALLFAGGWTWGGPTLALSWLVWGVGLRTVAVFHATWFVNSAAHTWGYQNYPNTGDHSMNLWWVALISMGEGWHNNHHAHPRSAAHGLRRFELDLTFWVIKLLTWVRLARDIHLPAADEMPGRAT